MDDDGVGVVFNGLFVPAQHEFGVGLAEIVLDHVVVAKLQRLSNVFQRCLVLLQFIVDHRDEVVDQAVLFIRYQAVPQ